MGCQRHMRSRVIGLVVLSMGVGRITARAYDTDSPYGVVAFIPSPTRWDAMQDANIAWGRYDFSWRSVEAPSKGVFNWAVTDDAVAEANARGLHIYAGLGYTPTWASAGGHSYESAHQYPGLVRLRLRLRESLQGFDPLLGVVERTQLERNSGTARRPSTSTSSRSGRTPRTPPIPIAWCSAPEISSAGPASSWMTNVLQQAGDKIDIICFHQYDGGDVPSGRLHRIDTMHNAIVAAGYANKPIWITECGWASDNIGEQKQANYLVAMLDGHVLAPVVEEVLLVSDLGGADGPGRAALSRRNAANPVGMPIAITR